MNMQEAASIVTTPTLRKEAHLRSSLECEIHKFLQSVTPADWRDDDAIIYQAILGEELPWITIKEDGWYIRGWYKIPSRLRTKIKTRALKILRRENRKNRRK